MVPVSVDSVESIFTVRVTAATPLRAALETLCTHATASCTLPASLPETLLTPRVIRGSWPEVVAELIGSSGLGFAATPPAPGRPAYLMVQAPVAAKAAPAPAAPGAASREQGALTTEEQPEEEAPVADAVDESNVTSADPEATLVTAATAASTPGGNFAMTPFTDGKGNPLMARLPAPGSPAATPGMNVLPYLDEAGYPMTVPITNEPLSLTPFVGPDGQAWPAPVAVPGQKLEYPIPPTPLPKPENH